jgi:glycosyltransferase involved in cell wall biosynthesis
MKFSIITPSYRNSDWLKLCIASVADQNGVMVEHIIQDACSNDGTLEWLPQDARVKAYIEKDNGMYDAINRGFRRASGDILAYLNCDEQYLPDALKNVEQFFNENPDVDVVLAGTVVVDQNSKYICHRPALVPLKTHIWFQCHCLTCSTFIRKSVITTHALFFDETWRALGDLHWFRSLLEKRIKMKVLNYWTSAFVDSGDNLCLQNTARPEQARTKKMTPKLIIKLRPLIVLQHRLRKLCNGQFHLKSTSYSVYTLSSPLKRITVKVDEPTSIWWNRHKKSCAGQNVQ